MAVVNQSWPTSTALAEAELTQACHHVFVFIYLVNLFIKPGPQPGSQENEYLMQSELGLPESTAPTM